MKRFRERNCFVKFFDLEKLMKSEESRRSNFEHVFRENIFYKLFFCLNYIFILKHNYNSLKLTVHYV